MAVRTITRLASAAVVTGIATLAFATPANAINPHQPDPNSRGSTAGSWNYPPAPTSADESSTWDLLPIATGALGGIALAGATVAAAVGLRRHHQAAHPA